MKNRINKILDNSINILINSIYAFIIIKIGFTILLFFTALIRETFI